MTHIKTGTYRETIRHHRTRKIGVPLELRTAERRILPAALGALAHVRVITTEPEIK